MNNEGFEFLADRLPGFAAELTFGLIRRIFLLWKIARQWAFNFRYPLPPVLAFGSLGEMKILKNLPVIFFEALPQNAPENIHGPNGVGQLSKFGAYMRFWWCRWVRKREVFVVFYEDLGQHAMTDIELLAEHFESRLKSTIREKFFLRICIGKEEGAHILSLGSKRSSGNILRKQCRLASGATFTKVFIDESDPIVHDWIVPSGVPSQRISVMHEILTAAAKHSKNPRPPIVQTPANHRRHQVTSSFCLERKFAKRAWFFGIGDVLLGSALLFYEAERTGRLAALDWAMHSVGSLLIPEERLAFLGKSERGRTAEPSDVAYQINGRFPVDFAFQSRVFTNRRPMRVLGEDCRDFLFRNFNPKPEIWRAATAYLQSNRLDSGHYATVHIRFGDKVTRKPEITETILSETEKLLKSEGNFVLLSDDPSMLEGFGGQDRVKVRRHAGSHSGVAPVIQESFNMLVDFLIIANSRECFQLSRYAWGSAFSQVACEIFGVPITHVVQKHDVCKS